MDDRGVEAALRAVPGVLDVSMAPEGIGLLVHPEVDLRTARARAETVCVTAGETRPLLLVGGLPPTPPAPVLGRLLARERPASLVVFAVLVLLGLAIVPAARTNVHTILAAPVSTTSVPAPAPGGPGGSSAGTRATGGVRRATGGATGDAGGGPDGAAPAAALPGAGLETAGPAPADTGPSSGGHGPAAALAGGATASAQGGAGEVTLVRATAEPAVATRAVTVTPTGTDATADATTEPAATAAPAGTTETATASSRRARGMARGRPAVLPRRTRAHGHR